MDFDPLDPFPLVSLDTLDNDEARRHAVAVDAWLGFELEAVERGIPKTLSRRTGQELWQHIPVQTMLTPYVELRAMLTHLALPGGSVVVDLGAAYGRMGFVIGRHHPDLSFTGYEYVLDRVLEGRRCLERLGHPNVSLEVGDLTSPVFKPRAADLYFIYDYGTHRAIEKTLADLRRIAAKRAIVVVGRGRAIRDSIERHHPWLSQVVAPEHRKNFSIYRSR